LKFVFVTFIKTQTVFAVDHDCESCHVLIYISTDIFCLNCVIGTNVLLLLFFCCPYVQTCSQGQNSQGQDQGPGLQGQRSCLQGQGHAILSLKSLEVKDMSLRTPALHMSESQCCLWIMTTKS